MLHATSQITHHVTDRIWSIDVGISIVILALSFGVLLGAINVSRTFFSPLLLIASALLILGVAPAGFYLVVYGKDQFGW